MRSFVVYRDEGSTHYFVVEYVAAKSVPTRHNVGASWSKLAQEHIPTMARTRLVLKTPQDAHQMAAGDADWSFATLRRGQTKKASSSNHMAMLSKT